MEPTNTAEQLPENLNGNAPPPPWADGPVSLRTIIRHRTVAVVANDLHVTPATVSRVLNDKAAPGATLLSRAAHVYGADKLDLHLTLHECRADDFTDLLDKQYAAAADVVVKALTEFFDSARRAGKLDVAVLFVEQLLPDEDDDSELDRCVPDDCPLEAASDVA